MNNPRRILLPKARPTGCGMGECDGCGEQDVVLRQVTRPDGSPGEQLCTDCVSGVVVSIGEVLPNRRAA